MPDHVINPVYERIRKTGRAPRRAAALAIGCGVMLAGFAAIAALNVMSGENRYSQDLITTLVMLTLGLGGLAALLCPSITLMAGAVITARQTRAEELALLRLTHLSGRDILGGLLRGIRYRLRLLRAVGLGLGLGIGLGLQSVGMIEMLRRRPDDSDYLIMAAIFMIEAWLVAAVRAAPGLGMALGMRGARGVLAASAAAGALLFLPGLVTLFALNRSPAEAGAASLALGLAILLAAVLIAGRVVTRAAAHTIDTAQGVNE